VQRPVTDTDSDIPLNSYVFRYVEYIHRRQTATATTEPFLSSASLPAHPRIGTSAVPPHPPSNARQRECRGSPTDKSTYIADTLYEDIESSRLSTQNQEPFLAGRRLGGGGTSILFRVHKPVKTTTNASNNPYPSASLALRLSRWPYWPSQ